MEVSTWGANDTILLAFVFCCPLIDITDRGDAEEERSLRDRHAMVVDCRYLYEHGDDGASFGILPSCSLRMQTGRVYSVTKQD